MKKEIRLIPFLLIFCAGCWTGSINPYYTPETVVRMPELNGLWYGVDTDKEGKEKRAYVEIKETKFYSYNDDGTKDSAKIVFFKVADILFADIQVDKVRGDRERPPHLLFKFVYEKDQLTYIPLDYTWLGEKAESGEIKISYIKKKDKSTVLFSAKPREWQEFIKSYKDNLNAFPEKEKFVLTRNN